MNYTRIFLLSVCLAFSLQTAYAQKSKKVKPSKKDTLVVLQTQFGDVRLLLYQKTPLHRQNFFKLVQENFFDSLLFHRVIKDFMIQGGDPKSRKAKPNQPLGSGGPGYQVPAEFDSSLFHKKGALAAARNNNPEKKSSGSQFYIVEGKKQSEEELTRFMQRSGIQYTAEQKKVYLEEGGTPFLDMNYTVFGEVIGGLDVVMTIAKQQTNKADRPLKDVKMSMVLEKIKKKKVTKLYGYTY